jgi:hypothetical protein
VLLVMPQHDADAHMYLCCQWTRTAVLMPVGIIRAQRGGAAAPAGIAETLPGALGQNHARKLRSRYRWGSPFTGRFVMAAIPAYARIWREHGSEKMTGYANECCKERCEL